jgi:hypothetical protein
MILAKPVIDQQYWILKQDDRKIGAVEAHGDGYRISTKEGTVTYTTIPLCRDGTDIQFEPAVPAPKSDPCLVHGYDTGCRAYNPVWNVKLRVPLFTREPKSRSWLAAGWYLVKKHRDWRVVKNPKLILLERYPYRGPFHSQEAARDQSV